jgi:hypothetical protein
MQNHMGSIIIMMNDVIGLLIALRFYNHFLTQKSMKQNLRYIGLGSLLVGTSILNVTVEAANILLFFSFSVFFVLGWLFYSGKTHVKVILASFMMLFSFVMELFTALLLTAIFGDVLGEIRTNSMQLFLGGVISKILLILFMEIIIHLKRSDASEVNLKSWFFILSIPVISVILSITSVYEPIVNNKFSGAAVFSCIAILLINIFVFNLLDHTVQQVNETNHYKYREKQLLMQTEHFENIIEGYHQVRRVRHDMMNHLVALHGYLQNEQCDDAIEYIKKINESIDFNRIGMVSNNVAIDALISNRKSKATQAGIYFEEKVSLPGKLQIDDMDMCIVIGNILNNAIEACQRMKNEQMKKHIMLNINYKKGHIFIEVENTYYLRTVKQEEGKFISSKKYQWKYDVGLGMSNIERIINKYGGVYQTDLSEAIFKIKIMLPDVSQS